MQVYESVQLTLIESPEKIETLKIVSTSKSYISRNWKCMSLNSHSTQVTLIHSLL